MDFFDCRYYSLSKKFLLLIGQWPYQDQTTRITRHISIVCVALSMTFVQVAILVTSTVTLNLLAEVISIQIGAVICMIKYFTYTVQSDKIKVLLENVKADWNSLSGDGDRQIAHQFAERGRKYNFYSMVYLYAAIGFVAITYGLQPLLEIIKSGNETYQKVTLYPGEYFVDTDKYFYPILFHMTLTILVLITILIANDTIYIACLFHACGMFQVVSNRLQHAYDEYKNEEEWPHKEQNDTRMRIATAIEYHKTATDYTERIISTYEVPMFMQILLVFLNISITLYCTAVSIGKVDQMLMSLIIGMSQMIQALLVAYPCQNVMDYSSAIAFNAYSSLWYKAPFKLQTLLLPIIQRGAKPTIILASSLMALTLESYGMAIQMSLSYFAVLLSFK